MTGDAAEELRLVRKDTTEDVGFLGKADPWEVLAEYYGDAFREYRRKWKLASNFEVELDFPLQLDFELNNTCNLRCQMCTWSAERITKAENFPAEKFKEIITDGVRKGLAALDLSFVNEPLIRDDLPDLISVAREAGVLDVGFNTNATLLDERCAEALLSSGLTRIQFSVDAHNPETYARVRKGGDYTTVLNNIQQFLRKKKDGGIKGLMTAVSFLRMSVNEHEWSEFVRFWSDKVDYILLREYLSPYGADSPNFEEKKKLFAGKKHIAEQFKCNKPWQRLIIRTDGTVLPCCTFHAVRLPMGNVFRQGISEIWTSDKMRNLRNMHRSGEYYKNKTCLECAVCSTV